MSKVEIEFWGSATGSCEIDKERWERMNQDEREQWVEKMFRKRAHPAGVPEGYQKHES